MRRRWLSKYTPTHCLMIVFLFSFICSHPVDDIEAESHVSFNDDRM